MNGARRLVERTRHRADNPNEVQDARASQAAPAWTLPDIAPRLLDLWAAAAYLSLSYWSVRDYVLAGLIPVVELPPLRPREGARPRKNLRRVLVDRADLDAFIAQHKAPASAEHQQCGAHPLPPTTTGRKRVPVPRVCPEPEPAQKPGGQP